MKKEVPSLPSTEQKEDKKTPMMGRHLSNAQVSFKDFPASDSNKLVSYNSSLDFRGGQSSLAHKLYNDI
jgi:hypothetical protein